MFIPGGVIGLWKHLVGILVIKFFYNSDDDCDTRTLARDEKIYPNADEFRPERFMEPVDAETARRRNPGNYVFGFGRRFVLKSLQYAECPDILI